MTGLLIALAVIVGWLAISVLCVTVWALVERLWRRVAARRMWRS